jgi:hypothetical protein
LPPDQTTEDRGRGYTMAVEKRRRVIRKGDVVVCHYTEEMETLVCRDCYRPFCVGLHYVTDVRKKVADRYLYCPAGHKVFLKASAA